jgi:quercetin dioxygenase-like cupin family protein
VPDADPAASEPGATSDDSAHQPGPEPTAHLLCDAAALIGSEPAHAGALWKLAEPGRQLDANIVHLHAHHRVETHTEPDLDVLLFVIAGHGTMETAGRTERLVGGSLFWLPRGSTRSIAASADGLSYLTVHRRRPGMQIRPAGG